MSVSRWSEVPMRNYSSRAPSGCPCLTKALKSSPAQPILECGGLPPLSSGRNVPQRNAPGEACLTRHSCCVHGTGNLARAALRLSSAGVPPAVLLLQSGGALFVNRAAARFPLRRRSVPRFSGQSGHALAKGFLCVLSASAVNASVFLRFFSAVPLCPLC
jgi:hypothetical protein